MDEARSSSVSASAQLELASDPLAQLSDQELLADAADSAAILGMGEGGMGAETLGRVRGELVAAVRELVCRWSA